MFGTVAGGSSALRSLFGMTGTQAPPPFIPIPRSRPALAFDAVTSALAKYRTLLLAALVPAVVLSATVFVRSNAEFAPISERVAIAPVAAEAPLPPAPAAKTAAEETQAQDRLARALQDASDAAARLATERDARIVAERRAAQLASEVDALALAREALARENAEKAAATEQERREVERHARRAAEENAAKLTSEAEALALQLKTTERAAATEQERREAERRARQAAEEAAADANEKLAHRSIVNVHTSKPVSPPPGPDPAAPATEANATDTIVAANEPQDAAVPPVESAKKTKTAVSELRDGEALLEKGHVDEARRHFERAAGLGLPEAALALGNTFDPASLAKAGIAHPGDRELARRWYRRAFALALRRKDDPKKRNVEP